MANHPITKCSKPITLHQPLQPTNLPNRLLPTTTYQPPFMQKTRLLPASKTKTKLPATLTTIKTIRTNVQQPKTTIIHPPNNTLTKYQPKASNNIALRRQTISFYPQISSKQTSLGMFRPSGLLITGPLGPCLYSRESWRVNSIITAELPFST